MANAIAAAIGPKTTPTTSSIVGMARVWSADQRTEKKPTLSLDGLHLLLLASVDWCQEPSACKAVAAPDWRLGGLHRPIQTVWHGWPRLVELPCARISTTTAHR